MSISNSAQIANPQQLSIFDYQALDAETRIIVQQKTSEIRTLVRRSGQDIIDIGQRLAEVKERLPHGQFGLWLESEFGWSQPTALNFMRVAIKFVNFTNLDEFAPSALYLLAAPSTPDEARQEAIDRAAQGETITYTEAKELVANHKPDNNHEPEHSDNGHDVEADEVDNEPPARDWLKTDDPAAETEAPQTNGDSDDRPYNYKRDAQVSRPVDKNESKGYDTCQTPPYAIDPLLPYLPAGATIWEPAAGENLMVEALYDSGFEVIPSDILTGQNFFEYQPETPWDCLVTNPPYSIKFDWLERCYQLGKPFALLLPVDTLGAQTAQRLFEEYGLELILLDKRVNFKMPNKGWNGGGAQFWVVWFTWGLGIGKEITYGKIPNKHLADWNKSVHQREDE